MVNALESSLWFAPDSSEAVLSVGGESSPYGGAQVILVELLGVFCAGMLREDYLTSDLAFVDTTEENGRNIYGFIDHSSLTLDARVLCPMTA